MWLLASKPIRSNVTMPTTSFSHVLWRWESRGIFCTNDIMCLQLYYDVIHHPCPINPNYLETWRVDSPEHILSHKEAWLAGGENANHLMMPEREVIIMLNNVVRNIYFYLNTLTNRTVHYQYQYINYQCYSTSNTYFTAML